MLAQGAGRWPEIKGELTFGKLADVITFYLRAYACGFWILQIRHFLSSRTCSRGGQGPKRTLGPGLLRNLQAPEDEERIPRRGFSLLKPAGHPHLLQCAYLGISAPLLHGVWSNGGWNKFHHAYRLLIYRGHHQFERHFLFRGSLNAGLRSGSCQSF